MSQDKLTATIALLEKASENGIKISIDNDELIVQLDEEKEIDSSFLYELKHNKAQLIAYLNEIGQSEQDMAADKNITAIPRTGLLNIPLSYSQERLWFIDQLEGSTHYHIPAVLRLRGPLNKAALIHSLQAIVNRHEVLHTVIYTTAGTAYQRIREEDNWQLTEIDEPAYYENEAALQSLIQSLIAIPFDLSAHHMLRAHLIRLGEAEHILVATMHHIAADGWSMSIIVRELGELYNAYITGHPAVLPSLDIQYADYAIWQRDYLSVPLLKSTLEYWKSKLAGVTTLQLPTDYVRPAVQRNEGATVAFSLDRELSDQLRQLSNQQGATLFMTLLAAFKVLLYRYTGQEDSCIGSPIAGRNRQELEGLVGIFINTLALRSDLSNHPSFISLLQQVKETTLAAYDHQEVPFEKIVEAVVKERDMDRHPLFQVMFSLQNTPPVPALRLGEVTLLPVEVDRVTAQLDLSLSILETATGLSGSIVYNVDLFSRETIVRMADHFKQLLRSVVATPHAQIGTLTLLTADEVQQLQITFNNTATTFPEDKTVVDLFASQAAAAPGATAVLLGAASLTYSELDTRSSQLAHHLRSKGITPEIPVAVCMMPSLEMIVGILGIMKAGGAYIPIDPEYPAERISYILTDTGVNMILSNQSLAPVLKAAAPQAEIVPADGEWSCIHAYPATPLTTGPSPEHLAYVIYTSGSTGQPKGVQAIHRSLVNLIYCQSKVYDIKKEERVLLLSNCSFDAAIEQIFFALLNGAALVLINKETLLDIHLFEQLLKEQGITHLEATNGFLIQVTPGRYNGLKRVISGGEQCQVTLAEKWSSFVDFYNIYGPTETTISATIHHYKPGSLDQLSTLPIGTPLPNVRAYILDAHGALAPIGVAGELYIAGAGVTRGYLNRPDLTTEKFIADTFSKAGGKMYATGDIAKWLPDGTIVYLGRKDEQVKIRGYRIEPAEIALVLEQCPLVKQAVVVVDREQQGYNRLISYIVPHGVFDREEIYAYLESKLPAYMIPAFMVALPEFPLTANGKIDKWALPQPNGEERHRIDYVAPRDKTEQQLAQIWQNVLGVSLVGIHDNFFKLGGHSLLVMRLMSVLQKELDMVISMKDLFLYPTIAGLSAHIKVQHGQSSLPPVVSVVRPARIPLSYSQERLWFIDQMEGSMPYHIPAVLRMEGNLDIAALSRALQTIINRHEVLRTVIEQEDGIACQRVLDKDQWQLHIVDELTYQTDHAALQAYVKTLINTPFDLSASHMLRGHLIVLGEEEYQLVITLHHIAADAWSVNIIVRELAVLYEAYTAARIPQLLPLPVQYVDYAIWQRNYLSGSVLDKKLDYWKEKLTGVQQLELPVDYRQPPVQSTDGAKITFGIDSHLSKQLAEISHQQGATLFMALLAVFKVLLHRYTGQADICVGCSTAVRPQQVLDGLIGFFVNTLALRSHVQGHSTFVSLLQEVKTTTLDAYDHADAPFEKVVEAVVKERDMSRNPLFRVMFVMQQGNSTPVLRLGNVVLSGDTTDQAAAKFDINFSITENEDGLHIGITYRSDLFRAEMIARMAKHFEQLLLSVVTNPLQEIGLLSMLPAAETVLLKDVFSGDVVVPPVAAKDNIADLFSDQAASIPSATALVFESSALSYRELEERSNQLACHLRYLGVKKGSLVVLCIERSPEMIVGLLGILKAGGAYVPVDPDYPQRIGYVLTDTGASVVVSSDACRGLVETSTVDHIIALDGDMDILRRYPVKAVSSTLCASDLAYVIYTSGSTGNPKGVMITHGNLLDYLSGLQAALPITDCHSFALLAGIATDLGNTILYHALTSGGSLHLFTKRMINDSEKLQTYFSSHSIDCLKIVPSHWKALSSVNLLLPAKLLIFGGEVLDADVTTRIFSSRGTCMVVNHYGPTETTIGKLLHIVERDRVYDQHIPIGRPFSNSRVYVLSERLQLCPVGIPGELFIGGDGVGAGYLNNAALTSERFIADPFSTGGRLYRTGDIVKYLPDGNIMFLGRRDDQLKIRGYRVELEEIARVLEGAPGVLQGVAVCHGEEGGLQRLTGYLVTAADYSRSAVDAYLQEHLPDYMIPSGLVVLDKFPLLSNGKIDRKSLRTPVKEVQGADYDAPKSVTEKLLSAIWCSLLELEYAGRLDNFFALGGHSLLAIRLVSAIRKSMEVEVSIGDIFDYPTIASLSAHLDQTSGRPVLPGIRRYDPRPAQIPLSYSQERLWFIDQLTGSVQYHVPHVLRLSGQLDRGALAHALQEIVNRHEVLRTVMVQQDGVAYQRVQDKDSWQLTVVSKPEYRDDPAALKDFTRSLINMPFDLSRDHMLRAHLIVLAAEEYVLVVTMHHIASDAWSKSIIVKELAELYSAGVDNRPAQIPALDIQYTDYAIWQREYLSAEILAQKIGYWKNKLADITTLQFPTDYARPVFQSTRGAGYHFRLSRELSDQLQALSRQQGTTLFMTLLTAFNVLLYRYSDQEDICVGTSIAGRPQVELEGLIGFFINTLVLRTDVSDDPAFTTLLKQVKQTTLEAYDHQEIPFEKIVEVVEKNRDMSRTSLFQVIFELFNTPDAPGINLKDLQLSSDPVDHITTLFDMGVSFVEQPAGLSGYVEYCADLFSNDTISRMMDHFVQLLQAIVQAPDANISSFIMLSQAEEQKLLTTFNDTAVEFPHDQTLPALFGLQAARTPDAVAVWFEGSQLSYGELDRQSDQLAHYLVSNGVKADQLVPVCTERSPWMLVALLGIMKAGGAYVPIDPAYPAARMAYILEDSKATIVVGSRYGKDKIPTNPAVDIVVVEDVVELPFVDAISLVSGIPSPRDLAYVIYTSGSTGHPKGVMVEHGGMLNHLYAKINDLGIDQDTVLAFTASYTFDISVWQMFSALLCGGCCVIYREDLIYDPGYLIGLIETDGITILELVPSYLSMLLQEETSVPLSHLKYLLVTGEAVSQPLLSRWFSHPDYGKIPVVNAYGPTEASDDICHYFLYESPERANIPVGKPVQNLQVYIVDSDLQLCPIGITGEICVSGVGVGRGYLNLPALTAEKFVANPFDKSGGKLYRTGDLGRWLPDGNIECLGRIDHQVKIRGYRIELGEIEHLLRQSESVSQAVVLVRADDNNQKRLVSYYVPDMQAVKQKEVSLYNQQEENWHELWETEYTKTEEAGETAAEFNLTGWNDSFTGKAIPVGEMREWLHDIVAVILSARPANVLEIGCGAGLIYYQLVGHIEKYVGIDFSSVSVGAIRHRISMAEREYPATILKVGAAHELSLDADEAIDLVIVNSVVQYFPGEKYLSDVLDKAISYLNGGGRIVLGDIRDNRLLRLFKTRLTTGKFQPKTSIREFAWGVEQEMLKEEELCLSPEYFYQLQTIYPQITYVDIQKQKGDYINELSLYRYTVIIYVGIEKEMITPRWQYWEEIKEGQDILQQLYDDEPVIALKGVPDPRLWKEILLEKGLKDLAVHTVGDLLTYAEQPARCMTVVNEWLALARAKGYTCSFLLDADPLKMNLLLEKVPSEGFITSVYNDTIDTRNHTISNIPLYADITESLAQDIRKNLQQRLPDYMVPADLIALLQLPLTNNGKIDRKFLSTREDMQSKSLINYQEPVTAAERQLVDIWQSVLGIARVGIYDDFFELGGHSLLATRAVSAIRKMMEVELKVKDFFLYPTIARLARYLQQQHTGLLLPVIEARERAARIPLSYSQERLWFIDQLTGSIQYHVPIALRLKGKMNKPALAFALQSIVNRHEVLRTVIREDEEGNACQVVLDKDQWELQVIDDPSCSEEALPAYVKVLVHQPFNLSEDHMLRVHLIVLGEEEHVLVVTLHHIASDGWSTGIIVKELIEFYDAYATGRPANLPVLNVQYADYAIWQRQYLSGEFLEAQIDYWKTRLSGVAVLQLPTDYPRPAIQSAAGASLIFRLDEELSGQLRALSLEHNCTLFMTLLAAFKVLLYRYTGQEDICVGSPIAGRTSQETEGLIGFFINTMALRSHLDNTIGFTELLQQVKETTLGAYEHQEIPFEKIVGVVAKERDMSRSPLFQVLFALQNTPGAPDLHLGDLHLSSEKMKQTTTQFDLSFSMEEGRNGLAGKVEYCTDLFSEDTIVRMTGHFERLLHAIVKAPETGLGELEMLNTVEEQLLVTAFNDTETVHSQDTAKTIVSLFEEQAALTPEHTALLYEDQHFTYRQLNEKANRLAHYLRHAGVKEETLVPVCTDRSPAMIIGILGILKAGGAYLPLDPALPVERLSFMLTDCKAGILVCNNACPVSLQTNAAVKVINTDKLEREISACTINNPEITLQPGNLAYVIYTSGSTGTPKGVMIEHRNILNICYSWRYQFGFDKQPPVVLSLASVSFDVFTAEYCRALLNGGQLLLVSEEKKLDVNYLYSMMKQYRVDTLESTPALIIHLLKYVTDEGLDFSFMRLLIVGSDICKKADYHYLYEHYSKWIRIINSYGVTETAIDASFFEGIADHYQVVPIGRPMHNVRYYILDEYKRCVPVGVAGELYIGGAGVGRGYINNELLNKEKFVTDSFIADGGKMYRTGDQARWLADGNVELIGRMDGQVKIRGYRIELGEIERVLQQCAFVSHAAVTAKMDENGNKKLVGYVVPRKDFRREEIISFLKSKLPEYMVPSLLMELEQLPLSVNGKIDKKMLPDPDMNTLSSNSYVAPRNESEAILASVWEELLQVQRVGIYDNFFELGGHSLLAMRLIAMLRKKMNKELAIQAVFRYATVADFAVYMENEATGLAGAPIEVYSRSGSIPLSFNQEYLWHIDQQVGSIQYHIPILWKIKGEVNREMLEKAFQHVVNRHEILRTVIRCDIGTSGQDLYQVVMDEGLWSLAVTDDPQYRENEAARTAYIHRLVYTPFDLSRDHTLRAHLIICGADEYMLVITLHHIAADAWSLGIMMRELASLYTAYTTNLPGNLASLNVQYADYAIWQRKYMTGSLLAAQLNYWKKQLVDVKVLALPLDNERPVVQSWGCSVERFYIDRELSDALQGLSQQQGTTLFMTLLAAFKVLLYHLSGEVDICVGASIEGRTRQEVEGLIGFFANQLPLRSHLAGNLPFESLLLQVKQTTLNAYEHQEVPFGHIADASVIAQEQYRHPLFQVMFSLQNIPETPAIDIESIQVLAERLALDMTALDLTLSMMETANGLTASIAYSTDLFHEDTIKGISRDFVQLLYAIVKTPAAQIDALLAGKS
ncbi:non-ribosomal peptide synthetase [Chitinophaga sp. HK235]|uniref:non-ribosomal peptide synthetase n=1 Tax=Chitinophaga sp. HK235 TaxID=2952571 RepID=UPI001BA7AFF8|nr:non-ribosomal peptide synthetase [Chitinophaga sp. HK235]